MKEELKIFENRSDDWLAKERAYEERVSAWDLDDAKYIKQEHHRIHVQKDIRKQKFKNLEVNGKLNSHKTNNNQKTVLICIGLLIVLYVLFVFFISGNFIIDDLLFGFPTIIVVFMMIVSNLKKERK